MVGGRIKSIRRVGNNGYASKSWETYRMILVYMKAQESILLNKSVRNTQLQRAEALQGSSVMANVSRSHLPMGDVTELSSLLGGREWLLVI